MDGWIVDRWMDVPTGEQSRQPEKIYRNSQLRNWAETEKKKKSQNGEDFISLPTG